MLVPGKRLAVFSIRQPKDDGGKKTGATIWTRAGSAFVNKDGSLNLLLDVLPMEGRLHVRDAGEKRDEKGPRANEGTAASADPMSLSSQVAAGGH